MKKKILLLLAFFVLLAGMMFSSAAEERVWADETATSEDGEWEYTVDGNGIIIQKYTGSETKLTGWGTIDDKTVTGIGKKAFSYCSSLVSIEIPSSVRSIGEWAFFDCSSLVSIEIPSSVRSIEENAFCGCSSLVSIEIPPSVTFIGPGVFTNCHSLTTIEIPSGVTTIWEGAFGYCSNLVSITIPDSVSYIMGNPFPACSHLQKIIVDSGNLNYESDGTNVLYNKGKTKLICWSGSQKAVSIPAHVTEIGPYAFDGCIALTAIEIPTSVTIIGRSAFTNTNLKDVYYNGSKEQWDRVEDYSGISGWKTFHYNSIMPETLETPEPPETPKTPEKPQKPTQTITAKNITKTYGTKAFSLNAKVNTGAKLTYSVSDKKVATVDKKGKVTIKGCGITNITITAAATGDYGKATKTIKLTVKPKKATLSSVKSTKKKTAAVKWKRNKEASGYIIQCATDSKFKKNKVETTISKNKTVSVTVKKLKAGKKCYVRVCAYAKSGKTKVQGDWSKVKTVNVKK